MLTSLDDTLWHQLPTTFDHVGTSDPRFFDRYWFAAYAADGSSALQMTMGAYRNMNVLDAGLVITHHGKQHNVRVSRTLGREIVTTAGPLTVHPTVPLEEFRLAIEPGEHGVSGELTWRGVAPPAEEKPHFARIRSRAVEDYQRFNQIGVMSGVLDIDGTHVTVDNWWACRDHSWGVRPRIGIKEPVTGPPSSLSEHGFAMAFLFFSTDLYAGHINFHKRGDSPAYVTGDLTHRETGEQTDIEQCELDVTLHPGTRRFSECTLSATLPDGDQVQTHCAALGSAIAMQGLGYSGGYNDHAGLGVWRGDNHLEFDVWDVSHPARIVYPDRRSNEHWHRIQPVAVSTDRSAESSKGIGSLTLIMSGHLPQFGLS